MPVPLSTAKATKSTMMNNYGKKKKAGAKGAAKKANPFAKKASGSKKPAAAKKGGAKKPLPAFLKKKSKK